MAARQSYLPALAEQALSSFEHVLLKAPGGGGNGGGGSSAGGGGGSAGGGSAAGGGATPWFEFGDAPLSWALPCGVLYDIVAPPPPPLQPSAETEASGSSSTGSVGDGAAAAPAAGPPLLPWTLTVHYRDAPAALLPAWGGVSAARGAYFTSLKARRPAIHSLPSFAPATFAQPLYLPWMSDLCDQADARYITLQTNGKRRHTKNTKLTTQEAMFICRGTEGANAVMRLAPAQQDALWRAVAAGRDATATPAWAALRAVPSVVRGRRRCCCCRLALPFFAAELGPLRTWSLPQILNSSICSPPYLSLLSSSLHTCNDSAKAPAPSSPCASLLSARRATVRASSQCARADVAVGPARP